MYFKKLEIIGFKSFADKTTLTFEPGITAIIGPNGCGKSNIFDSIRWVLGEQSIKSLRGSKMEDVIFNGTETRLALNMSEVSLTFSNEAKFFPIEYDEVTITRRLFRSGESEYLLNKTVVRLKDITELLLGTGIGAESYSLVEQGKIDLILSSRPEDRRLVFDEAAGVTKYKSQKKEALRKLEDTENNLLRVNDIIIEVKRQINSLERQANKAKRYREEFEKLKDLEVKFSKLEIKVIKDELNSLLNKIDALKHDEVGKNATLSELNVQIHNLRLEISVADSQINKLKDEDNSLANILDKNAEFIRINEERIRELDLRAVNLNSQLSQIEERRGINQKKLDNLSVEMSGLSGAEEEKRAQLAQKNSALEVLAEEIKKAHLCIAEARRDVLSVTQNEAGLKNELSGLNTKISTLSARQKRLKVEYEKVIGEKDGLDAQVTLVEGEVKLLREKLDTLKQDEERLKNDLGQAKGSLSSLEESAKKLEAQKLTLESQLIFLEKLKLEYEDIPELFNGSLILDRLPQEPISGILSKVKEIKKNDSGLYEVICEAKPIPLDTSLIKEKIEKTSAQIDEIRLKIGLEKERIDKIDSDLTGLSDMVRQEEIALSGRKTSLSGLTEQLLKLVQELELINMEEGEAGLELSRFYEHEAKLKSDIILLEEKRKADEALIAKSTDGIATNNNVKEEINVFIARISAELSSLEERRLALSGSLRFMQETLDNDRHLLESAKEEVSASIQKKEALGAQNTNMRKEILDSEIKKESVLNSLEELKKKFEELACRQQDKESQAEALHIEISQIKDSVHKLSMQDKETEFKESAIKERMLQAYKLNLDEVTDISEEMDRNGLLGEIEQIKKKVNGFGTVNLVAIEEHDELRERHEFLTNQHNDLVSAKESLKEAITKINKTTKQLFLDTFHKVSEEFKVYFRLLFGGGDAQLMLIDEEDVLESGIEIIARPPGKKLQNVLLLSGGEKAMTAIALIFAIFKVKPSPFCVLDEIDAALDESNADRFSRMLQEFIKTSQFLMITHNKKTITSANVMYGITMEERGISKIVSAKLSQESKELPSQKAISEEVPA